MFNENTLISACTECKGCEHVPLCPLKAPLTSLTLRLITTKKIRLIRLQKEYTDRVDIQDFPDLICGIRAMRRKLMKVLEFPH